MKKRILLIIFLVFLSKTYSQNSKITFQLSAGTTLSLPKTSNLIEDTHIDGAPIIKSSINIGGYILPSINYMLNNKSSLDFGIGFYLDRFSIEEKIGFTTKDGTRNISQIQTPFNYNFHFGKEKAYKFGVGGFVNFILNANEKGIGTINTSLGNIVSPDDYITTNQTINYNESISHIFNTVSFGAFIQLKKTISFSSNKKGFILLKINQHINTVKSIKPSNYDAFNSKNENNPTTINLGVGINLF